LKECPCAIAIRLLEKVFSNLNLGKFGQQIVWEFSLFNVRDDAVFDLGFHEFPYGLSNFLNRCLSTFSSLERNEDSPRKSKLESTILFSFLIVWLMRFNLFDMAWNSD
jgi:hypothetical protein